MKELEYERVAMEGGEMPDNMDSSDQIMFLKLRLLYATYKRGDISREQAKREKTKFLKEYELDCKLHKLGLRWVNLLAETEKARTEYRKNRTIENADKILLCIEGIER